LLIIKRPASRRRSSDLEGECSDPVTLSMFVYFLFVCFYPSLSFSDRTIHSTHHMTYNRILHSFSVVL
jgi:hypothetical protein